jgi:hypothetical protein
MKPAYVFICLISTALYPAAEYRSSLTFTMVEEEEQSPVPLPPQTDDALAAITQADTLLTRRRRTASEPDMRTLEQTLEVLSATLIGATVFPNDKTQQTRLSKSISDINELMTCREEYRR